jgi:hypothetical protein
MEFHFVICPNSSIELRPILPQLAPIIAEIPMTMDRSAIAIFSLPPTDIREYLQSKLKRWISPPLGDRFDLCPAA